jgi:hypothetical protein
MPTRCVVPHCPNSKEGPEDGRYICSWHLPGVPERLTKLYKQAMRKKRQKVADRIWADTVHHAVWRALGTFP